jgi:hypothetical protein
MFQRDELHLLLRRMTDPGKLIGNIYKVHSQITLNEINVAAIPYPHRHAYTLL